MSSTGAFMPATERLEAKVIGAERYVNGKRYQKHRERVFDLLDGVVQWLEGEGFPDPYNGYAIGAFAQAIVQADQKALGRLRKEKVPALDDRTKRTELFRLIGCLVAEDYLKSRKDRIPPEPPLRRSRPIAGKIGGMLERMTAAGRELEKEDVYVKEVKVSYASGDAEAEAADVARRMIEQAIGVYEELVPESDDRDEVPDPVERRAIAKAAFLRLHVDALEDEATQAGIERLPSKDAMATALAERYADELDKAAEIVLRREKEDVLFGLITRLLPLREPPALDDLEAAFRALEGHYVEARTASFFIFGEVTRSQSVLRVRGKVRSFSVNPAEAGGAAQLNFRPFSDELLMTVRAGEPWVEVNARRTGDLATVRSVLRRTGEVTPAAAVPVPDALTTKPYDIWDPRTLWMLDFLRHDLRSRELSLDNTLMANFLSPHPAAATGNEGDEADGGDPSRRPAIEAVRLLGTQLQDHPEACARIAAGARLHDLEVRVRHVYDLGKGYNRLVRFRLSWEDDHLAVLSGAADGKLDADVHRLIVRLVRQAAPRQLSEDALKLTLRRIERRAEESDVGADQPGVLDDESSAAS